ncbi:dTMP kinase [Bartonella sp. DGB1]|uniref:dTMP kinase n=1 Tax=Bartonella sp. DGB1 TaxID=3239807 RepID=UPI003526AE9B
MLITTENYEAMWSHKPYAGLFIAMCGFDGSGKTTQTQNIANVYSSKRKVIKTYQPTNWYRNLPEVRAYLDKGSYIDLQLLALFAAADRRKHSIEVIEPALLSSDTLLISDRYIFSLLSYFSVIGMKLEYIINLNRNLLKPTLSFYLDVPSSVILQRLKERDGSILKFEEKLEFIEKVCAVFRYLTTIDEKFILIDGTLSESQITKMLCELIERKRNTYE